MMFTEIQFTEQTCTEWKYPQKNNRTFDFVRLEAKMQRVSLIEST